MTRNRSARGGRGARPPRAGQGSLPIVAALALAVCLCACRFHSAMHRPDPEWNRMLKVPRYDIYEESQFFPDHMTMRVPPEGTLSYGQPVGDPAYLQGLRRGEFVRQFPLELTETLLERGRGRFERICSACHGMAGYGNYMVIRHMQRPAPSLHLQRIRELPPGKIFFVISNGYGFMPDYSAKLDVHDRWAVVAYVKALQRSQYAPVAELPSELREELSRRLPR